jgi:hypothetical protein
MISTLMIVVQAILTITIISAMPLLPIPRGELQAWQAAGAALALALALAMASILKARLLCRLLDAPVQGWRWSLIWAGAAALLVGFAVLAVPRRFEWIQLALGAPAILLTFGFMVWYRGFTQEDRALFRKHEAEAPELPETEIATP